MPKQILLFLASYFVFWLTVLSSSAQKKNEYLSKSSSNQFYAILRNDTLRIGNSTIERVFLWNGGNLKTCEFNDKKNNQPWKSAGLTPDLYIPNSANKSKNGKYLQRKVPSNGIHPAYFEAEVSLDIDSMSLKRVFRLYADCPVIACDTYLKGVARGKWSKSNTNVADLKNIENINHAEADNDPPILDQLNLSGKHWALEVVDFLDVTDRNNTLVKPYKGLSYKSEIYKGNILFADNKEAGKGLFILKEAPCSNIQLAYPGGDFITNFGQFKVIGLGIEPSDLSLQEWTKTYSCAIGLYAGNGANKYTNLHEYQKLKRLNKAAEDNMVMMNTWGDRGRDTKVNEAFCLKEILAAARLGATHFQIDDGWQTGRSANSAFWGGSFKNIWSNPDYWKPDVKKYPHGLKPLVDAGRKSGVKICLWFNPSIQNNFADWEKDAEALLNIYKNDGIKVFKIDGVNIPNKTAENNLRKLFDKVVAESNGAISFNLDVTAGRRGGYFYFNEYGNIFLENRYTDWQNYYPYWTLRNLWMLSKYTPTQKIQVEFLNKWRNQDKYGNDKFSPSNYSFNYLFAITMAGQPLAWMEGTGLPEEAFETANTIKKYKEIQADFHQGTVLPIGDEPSGQAWTGFQSINNKSGYLLVFREDHPDQENKVAVFLPPTTVIQCKNIFTNEPVKKFMVDKEGKISFNLTAKNSFIMYQYQVIKNK
ncbi:alpha-galactosidase [Pedobacter petrophilus]|uniref:Alpha-galactosidase n=1 Tax=Pedobacter petrophilus TaxID=1908241 RepID=A0A7K0FZF4_9SPHI|nr:alpha-galactosidase [Pedobacter petrophilus]MRX76948.1 alpha-galactosidase [Pedobacter petrophilus]